MTNKLINSHKNRLAISVTFQIAWRHWGHSTAVANKAFAYTDLPIMKRAGTETKKNPWKYIM